MLASEIEGGIGGATVGGFGDLRADGFRVTRWDRTSDRDGQHVFDAGSLLVCLNLAGKASAGETGRAMDIEPGQVAMAFVDLGKPTLERVGRSRHQFVTLELRRSWVARWLPTGSAAVRPPVREFLKPIGSGEPTSSVEAMSETLTGVAHQLLRPPGLPGAWACWHHGKALEVAAHGLFTAEEEFFCRRTQRIASERVVRVRELLVADLEHPPILADLGRLVGCSPFYLSRIFRDETGRTISQFLRSARLARAAEILRGGEGNVTEAAMAVGYSSLSHFSKAFAKEYGCCPCLYGAKKTEAAGIL